MSLLGDAFDCPVDEVSRERVVFFAARLGVVVVPEVEFVGDEDEPVVNRAGDCLASNLASEKNQFVEYRQEPLIGRLGVPREPGCGHQTRTM